MGRPRGFDPDAAVRTAMTLFWQRGYDSVSFDRLVGEIGASRKGLYALWPDKQALLVAALKSYRQMIGDHFLGDLEREDAGVAELAEFWSKFENAARQSGWSGCLVMRTSADRIATEPGVGRHTYIEEEGAMYIPASFKIEELQELHDVVRAAPLPNLVISDDAGLVATPLPLLLDESEGEFGVLYGHVAKANPIWRATANPIGLAIFMGPDAYVTPSWYATKRETGKVVPTWNYVAVHAYGVPEFINDEDRLLAIISRQTNEQEARRPQPWAVSDAPEGFIRNQLSAIVGVRMPIRSIEGKRKMSQNRTPCDRIGVANGLSASGRENDRAASALIPR